MSVAPWSDSAAPRSSAASVNTTVRTEGSPRERARVRARSEASAGSPPSSSTRHSTVMTRPAFSRPVYPTHPADPVRSRRGRAGVPMDVPPYPEEPVESPNHWFPASRTERSSRQDPQFVQDTEQFRYGVRAVADHGGLVLARRGHPERLLAQALGRP